MHFPDEPENNPSSNPINQWAHLEGKSDSMADDLAHQADTENTTLSVTARLLGLFVAIAIVVLLLLAAVFSDPNSNEPPKAETPASHQRAYP